MKATKLAMAALMMSLAAMPLIAQSTKTGTRNHARTTRTTTTVMYDQNAALQATLKSITAEKIDVQPAALTPGSPAFSSLAFNSSNYGNVVVMLASFPQPHAVSGPGNAHVVQTNYTPGNARAAF